MRRGRVTGMLALLALAGLGAAGCATRGAGDQRVARYRPDDSDRSPLEWARVAAVAGPEPAGATNGAAIVGEGLHVAGEFLRRGDALLVYLKGIPQPEELKDEVDEVGAITLPLIGKVLVAGLKTSQAEDAIQKAYIDGGYYKKIDVIVVAEAGGYYVRGEVKQAGRYPISGDITLVQAITTAGGYTDFARPSKIKVIRGQKDMIFNADRIEDGKDPDPLIKANDTIIVPRRWM